MRCCTDDGHLGSGYNRPHRQTVGVFVMAKKKQKVERKKNCGSCVIRNIPCQECGKTIKEEDMFNYSFCEECFLGFVVEKVKPSYHLRDNESDKELVY
jgi:hypothetical protein